MLKPPIHRRRFGEAVRAERRRLKLSQEELAHRSDLNRVYMGEVERGEKAVSIDTIVKIAGALNITSGELMSKADI